MKLKKGLLFGSLVLAFIIGCSDKANVESSEDSLNNNSSSINSNTDNVDNNSTISGGMSDSESNMSSMNSDRYGSLKSIYFKFDKFNIDGDNISVVKSNADFVMSNNISELKVEGNTDEWGSDEYNYALALKRASSAKDALVSNGVSANIIKLVSYGESKPKCIEKTKQCWQENRRVDFVAK